MRQTNETKQARDTDEGNKDSLQREHLGASRQVHDDQRSNHGADLPVHLRTSQATYLAEQSSSQRPLLELMPSHSAGYKQARKCRSDTI